MTENERRANGLLFFPGDPELKAMKLRAHKLNQDYNRLYEDETEERNRILSDLLGSFGTGSFIQGPITFHYGKNTFIGDKVFINFNFTVQDDATVTIGNNCDFGPNVTIVTPVHPLLPDEREKMITADGQIKRLCYAKPVIIEPHCWICANTVILPGVTIGEGSVIGAGSVVTKSIPPHSFAAGNPCRVIRELTDNDTIMNNPDVLGGCSVIKQKTDTDNG